MRFIGSFKDDVVEFDRWLDTVFSRLMRPTDRGSSGVLGVEVGYGVVGEMARAASKSGTCREATLDRRLTSSERSMINELGAVDAGESITDELTDPWWLSSLLRTLCCIAELRLELELGFRLMLAGRTTPRLEGMSTSFGSETTLALPADWIFTACASLHCCSTWLQLSARASGKVKSLMPL